MSEGAVVEYECPGCGMPVRPGDDYVVARKYAVTPEFSLHMSGNDVAAAPMRRFHVEHFRGLLHDHFYELVDKKQD
jgi:hypothetical protein